MGTQQTIINRARQYIAQQPFYLDTETTGVDTLAEIVEICILDPDGAVLLDTLVRPRRKIPAEATRIHGISNSMVSNAPLWNELWIQIEVILKGRSVGIYNAEFDLRMIKQTHLQSGMAWQSLNANAFCIMKLYAEFFGERDRYRGSYRWQTLDDAGRQCGIALPNAHRAQADTLLTRALLHHMAGHS